MALPHEHGFQPTADNAMDNMLQVGLGAGLHKMDIFSR